MKHRGIASTWQGRIPFCWITETLINVRYIVPQTDHFEQYIGAIIINSYVYGMDKRVNYSIRIDALRSRYVLGFTETNCRR